MNISLREKKPTIFSSRRVTLKTLEEKGIDNLKKKIINNLNDVLKMMDWNENNGIKVFRLSSEIFPHYSNKKAEDYTLDFAIELLKKIGIKSKEYNQRLTFHPGQYNCLGSPHEDVIEHTIRDLKYHADILDIMELDQNSVMVIHGGGIYKNKEETIERWCKNYEELPDNIKNRLVLENCENINKNITVNLNDVYKGINTEIKIQIKKHCLKCIKKCENCNGSGTVKQIRNMGILTQISESTCNICKGRGEIHNKNKNCNECKGNGSYIKEEKTKLIVNPGFPDKYKKVFKGFGEQPTTNNQKAGDLILEINIDKNHVLKREGNNLYYSIEVDFIDSVIGKDINIPYFDNSININTSTFGILLHGKKYMLEGKGLPIFNNENKFGNMFVDFSIKQCKIKNNDKLNELKILLNEMIN